MGIFGSSKKITVGTQIQRVLEDDALPNSIQDGMTSNLFDVEGGGNQMTEYVMDALSNSIGLRAQRMWDYGKEEYLYGLPEAAMHSSMAGKAAAQTTIAAQEGGPVQITYYRFGAPNLLHLAWKALVEQHGYDYATNKLGVLSADKGVDVFLSDMQVVVVEATLDEWTNGSLDQWGDPPNAGPSPQRKYQTQESGKLGMVTPFAVDAATPYDYVRVDASWEVTVPTPVGTGTTIGGIEVVAQVPKKQLMTESFTISMADVDGDKDYHQARYIKPNGSLGYWVYEAGTGTHPEIDVIFDQAYGGTGNFFPFAYFRYNKQKPVEETTEYEHGEKLLKHLNMEYENLVDSMNANPDIADVEQAMMMMAVPVDTTNEMEQRYLFDFFNTLEVEHTATNDISSNGVMSLIEDTLRNSGLGTSSTIIIQDGRFKMGLRFSNIVKRGVAGTIGDVGTYTSGYGLTNESIEIPKVGGGSTTKVSSVKKHWFRYQVSADVYKEVQVYGLSMTYFIKDGHNVTAGEDDDILLIPLDANITKTYSIPEREELYSRSLHYIFNSYVITKLKWYQTGVFRAILLIIAIIITIISYGSTWQSIGAALAAGTITLAAVLYMFLIGLMKYLLVTMAVKLFVKAVGTKIAFIAAIVAAIYGVSTGYEGTSLYGAPFAEQMLQISTSITKEIGKQAQNDMNSLLAEQSEFEQYVEEQTKTLETAQELLDSSIRITPLVIFGESPDHFYQRTVHSGNIALLGIDAISSYVDVALQLPTLPQTLGDV